MSNENDRTFDDAARAAIERAEGAIAPIIRDAELWFRCPKCGQSGIIDGEQSLGRVSIVCVNDECDFHATGDVQPVIFSGEPLRLDQQFTIGAAL